MSTKQNNQGRRTGNTEKKRQNLALWTAVAFVVLLIGFGLFGSISNMLGADEAKETAKVDFAYEEQPMLGDANAPVALVEFADFKCPSCKAFHTEILPQLKKDYIDTGKVRLYYLNFPVVSADSETAAMASEAVYSQNKEAFWDFYDLVYDNQQSESLTWATEEYFVELAKKELPSIDADKLAEDLDKNTFKPDLQKDQAIGLKANVRGTPTIYVNDKMVQQFYNYDEIKALIEEELNRE